MQSIVHAYWNAIHELRFQDVRELFCDTAELHGPIRRKSLPLMNL